MNREELLKIAKPILFNTEMVQAILDNRKTVTRRIIPRKWFGLEETDKSNPNYLMFPDEYGNWHDAKDLCRYQVGDILYVRETFRYVMIGEADYFGECLWDDEVIQYKASEDEFDKEYAGLVGEYRNWKPSIHMPKEAARIFLKVTDVRVERLQDITAEQQENELGILDIDSPCNTCPDNDIFYCGGGTCLLDELFIGFWNSTIKKQDLHKYGWKANPWVWVIKFQRVKVE